MTQDPFTYDDPYDPNLSNNYSTITDPKTRFVQISSSLTTNASLIPLNDLLFILSSSHLGPLPPPAVQSLYEILLNIDASRFLFSTLHYNQLLAHLIYPYRNDFSIPVPAEVKEQVDHLVSDMDALDMEKDGPTYMLMMLSNKDNPATVNSLFSSMPENLQKQMPIAAYNLLLHVELCSDESLSDAKVRKIYQRLAKSRTEPDISTYELLLTAFGVRLVDGEAMGEVLEKLKKSGLSWRNQTYAAALEAIAACGNEEMFDQVRNRMNKFRRLLIDRRMLNAILRFYLNISQPDQVLPNYYHFTKETTIFPPAAETYAILIQACAEIPDNVLPEQRDTARLEAYESLALIRKEMEESDEEMFDTWELLAKCYAKFGDKEGVLDVYETVNKRREGYIPGLLMLRSLAEVLAKTGNASAIRFLVDVMLKTKVIKTHHDRERGTGVEPFEKVYEALVDGWLHSGKDPEEIVEIVREMRLVEKHLVRQMKPIGAV